MINSTAQFGQELYNGNRNYLCLCKCVLRDGTKLTFDNTSLMSYELTDSTSSDGFEIGAAAAKTLSISIQNYDDQYSDYDFYLAEITTYIGLLVNGKIEYLPKGHFTVDEPAAYGSEIKLSLVDDMYKFSDDWQTELSYPATIFSIVTECCLKCGVPLHGHFDNDDIELNKPDDTANMTYRDVISYCAQITGNYAKMTTTNTLHLSWYDMSVLSGVDGGTFHTASSPYSDGDDVDGGNFLDYSGGDSADGGEFTRNKYTVIYGHSTTNIGTDDIVITGIQVEVEEQSYLAGTSGYVLDITDNPFITEDNAETICSILFQKIGGMTFRKFSVECVSDPRREAGDPCVVIDRKGNEYYSIVTNITFKYGSNDSVSNDAEDVIEKSSKSYSAATKALISAKKYTNKKLSAYDEAVKNMNALAANSMGYYVTYDDDPDTGARISYEHDAPTLDGSTKVWKRTENGLYWTNDYKGESTVWSYGYDVNGNAVMNTIATIGILFDWARGGTLTLGGTDNGNGVQHVVDEKGNILITLDKRGITLADGVYISYDHISNQPDIVKITKDTINAPYINGLKIKAGSVDAENITGETISGKTISGGTIKGSNISGATIDGGSIHGGSIELGDNFSANSSGFIESKTGNIGPWHFHNDVFLTNDYKLQFVQQPDGTWSISNQSGLLYTKNITATGKCALNDLQVTGTKSRSATTDNYNERLLYCYEMPSPMFGDIGEGILDEKGQCIIWLDDIFSETIDIGCTYHVFTQTYGDEQVRITERNPMYFVANGKPYEKFAWEVKAIQRGFDTLRLEKSEEVHVVTQDVIDETYLYLNSLMYNAEKESEEIVNEEH